MHARVSTFEGDPGRLDDSTRRAMEQTLPAVRQFAGFEGVLSLVDRTTGKSITITLWRDEQAMRQSEEAANRLRTEGADAAGESIVSVERYEVAMFEAPTAR